MPAPEMQQRASLLDSLSNPDKDPHAVSSIPPWVHVNNAEDTASPTLPPPQDVRPNTRHYKPPPNHYRTGRKWDHLRSAEPALLSQAIADEQVRWAPFMSSGPNPHEYEGGARVVSQSWMEENMPFLSKGWDPSDDAAAEGGLSTGRSGLMYRGLWVISPERQERTVRLFWVSSCSLPSISACAQVVWSSHAGVTLCWTTASRVGPLYTNLRNNTSNINAHWSSGKTSH